jgi:hypothetical protein
LQGSSHHWRSLHVHRNPQNSFCLFIYSCEFYSKDDHDDHVFNTTYAQNFVAFLFAVMGLLCQIPLNYKMGNNNNNNNSCCCSTPAFLPSSPDPHTHTSHLKMCLWVEEIDRCVCVESNKDFELIRVFKWTWKLNFQFLRVKILIYFLVTYDMCSCRRQVVKK